LSKWLAPGVGVRSSPGGDTRTKGQSTHIARTLTGLLWSYHHFQPMSQPALPAHRS
jgi:hypothetical protein